jgi:hypothetical protein
VRAVKRSHDTNVADLGQMKACCFEATANLDERSKIYEDLVDRSLQRQ